jgi:hypothetical protein
MTHRRLAETLWRRIAGVIARDSVRPLRDIASYFFSGIQISSPPNPVRGSNRELS